MSPSKTTTVSTISTERIALKCGHFQMWTHLVSHICRMSWEISSNLKKKVIYVDRDVLGNSKVHSAPPPSPRSPLTLSNTHPIRSIEEGLRILPVSLHAADFLGYENQIMLIWFIFLVSNLRKPLSLVEVVGGGNVGVGWKARKLF